MSKKKKNELQDSRNWPKANNQLRCIYSRKTSRMNCRYVYQNCLGCFLPCCPLVCWHGRYEKAGKLWKTIALLLEGHHLVWITALNNPIAGETKRLLTIHSSLADHEAVCRHRREVRGPVRKQKLGQTRKLLEFWICSQTYSQTNKKRVRVLLGLVFKHNFWTIVGWPLSSAVTGVTP